MTFADLLPHAKPWVQHLILVWPAYVVKPNFAVWEVFHILSLILLGGCTILIGLRLTGGGLTEEPPSEIYRNLRGWLHLGVVGIIVTGILIGMANAERLYASAAFLVKMLALLSAVIFTYGVTRPVALADGRVSAASAAFAALALAVYAVGVVVFLTGGLITPGLFHVMTAAALIVLVVVRGRARVVYAAGVAVILLAMYLATHVFIGPDDLARSDPANVALAWVMALWIAGAALLQAWRGLQGAQAGAMTRVTGYATILIWVTAGAAGRWIAFA